MELDRYSRQMLFSPIGENGQMMLSNCAVLVIGVGALGTVICNHLVRAGVGKIRIVDRDYVEYSNLQRQMLFDEIDAKEAIPKAVAAKNKLKKINSKIEIESIITNVTKENISELIAGIDLVMDGTDNFSTRFLLNDICFKENIPFSYGGVVGARGMTAFFIPNETPCLRCFVKVDTASGQTCDTIGVISPAVDIVSSLQVTEALKYLTNNKHQLRNSLFSFDVWSNQTHHIKFTKHNASCPTCVLQKYPAVSSYVLTEETVLCGRNTVQIHLRTSMNLSYWEKKLAAVANIKSTPFLLKVHFESIQFVIFPDGRVLVQGTDDIATARTWYDRYIGS